MYVYIMSNERPTLYVGVTANLADRIWQHKNDLVAGFTMKYKLHDLIYYEEVDGELQAIGREKQIKDMNRIDKLAMIKKMNPNFVDLSAQILDA